MKKTKREYFIRSAELSTEENENKKFITGVIPYNSKSEKMGNHFEVIAASAFTKTINDKSNVYAFYNHDDSKVLGSTKAGTFELSTTDSGLVCRCEINTNTSFGNDAYETIKSGNVKTMSFGFIPLQVKDEADTETITEAKLIEVSFCVAFPAYAETNAETRSIKIRGIEMNFDELNEIMSKEVLTDEEKNKVNEIISALQEKVGNKPDEEKPVAPSTDKPTETAACAPAANSTEDKTNTDEADKKKKEQELQRKFDFEMRLANI